MLKNRRTKNNRPLLVWLAAIWSLVRAILPLIGLYGSYHIYQQFAVLQEGPGTTNITFPAQSPSFLLWVRSSDGLPMFIETALLLVVFLLLAIGIFQAIKGAEIGFILASACLVLWRLHLLFNPIMLFAPILYSLSALLIAFWLFRQAEVRHFFQSKYRFGFLQFKKVPIDLILSLASFLAATIINYYGV
jgi:hypothetical protein